MKLSEFGISWKLEGVWTLESGVAGSGEEEIRKKERKRKMQRSTRSRVLFGIFSEMRERTQREEEPGFHGKQSYFLFV